MLIKSFSLAAPPPPPSYHCIYMYVVFIKGLRILFRTFRPFFISKLVQPWSVSAMHMTKQSTILAFATFLKCSRHYKTLPIVRDKRINGWLTNVFMKCGLDVSPWLMSIHRGFRVEAMRAINLRSQKTLWGVKGLIYLYFKLAFPRVSLKCVYFQLKTTSQLLKTNILSINV